MLMYRSPNRIAFTGAYSLNQRIESQACLFDEWSRSACLRESKVNDVVVIVSAAVPSLFLNT